MIQRKEKNPEDIAFQKEFGKYIKSGREKLCLYQNQVAEQLGLSQQYYSKIENGIRNVDFVLALKICNLLKLDINDFIKTKINP